MSKTRMAVDLRPIGRGKRVKGKENNIGRRVPALAGVSRRPANRTAFTIYLAFTHYPFPFTHKNRY